MRTACSLSPVGHFGIPSTSAIELRLRSARAVPWSSFSEFGFLGRPPRGLDIVYDAQNRVSWLNKRIFGFHLSPAKGAAVVTMRDYDALIRAGVSTQGPRVYGELGLGRRVIIQLWDWEDGRPVYNLEHIILTETADGYRTSSHSCRCRALMRTEVEQCFVEAGASSVEWLESEASGFYQPIMWVNWPD